MRRRIPARIAALAAATLVTLAGPAAADEKDGGHAAPRRWTHARGPAACNGRTFAAPPRSWGGPRWTYRAKRGLRGAPVTWDGVVFVLDGSELVALHADDGAVIARAGVDPALPEIAVEAHCVLVREKQGRLALLRLRNGAFERVWTHEAGRGASAPRILGGEVYLVAPDGLLMVRLGARGAAWTAKGEYAGAPAVYGRHVYALRKDGGNVTLVAHDRADGTAVASVGLGAAGAPGLVSVSQKLVVAELGGGAWAFCSRKLDDKDKKPVLAPGGRHELRGIPLVGRRVAIAAVDGGWAVLRVGDNPRSMLVKEKDRPELVRDACAPIAHPGSDIGFGTWCADVNANEIHWHAAEGDALAGGAACVVPARHREVLVVASDRRSMVLLAPRKIGKEKDGTTAKSDR